MNRKVVIKFFAPVIDITANALLNAIDQKLKVEINEKYLFPLQVVLYFRA